ncbi:uncharacterized protein SPPG_03977 [Spizellomyces punctatus DAOM BR117]|uniref:Uncharacterized protein n=1 Tax=Spizellomyces punctatus (strain DAOM BR117) TaxID=645134 RepID=A0A0L0HIZ9_SPIPD|nr:uncharacterized protein SPPG_03977 [Spizellomyces punctatus DAOM BR117]KND00875.1 hypothetical protein SPPG_03977 [Spizellomyces punctatus DAOM BR117]|eukprot:XP_016608914.1 hypothetical protein SPPG_03977 [Spizellomyces punctatus DAOM BR117]
MEPSSDPYHDLIGLPPPITYAQETHQVIASPSAATEAQTIAANVIQRAWKRFHMKATFRWLKENLIRAERSMTMEILRRLSPREAELIKDPVVQGKVRFRFGGSSFPPTIMYKIYTKSNSVHYYSGHRLIQADTQAAVDSCAIMGVRLYSENMIRNEYQNRALKISHSDEVTNRLEFVQYLSSLDCKPAYLGGRNNGWRELNITPFTATQNLIYDARSSRRSTRFSSRNGTSGIAKGISNSSRPSVGRVRKQNPKSQNRTRQLHRELEPELDDDFDPLFEWANDLSLDSLADYVVGEVMV